MEPTKGILIWNFGSMTDADLAASQLRSAGLDCTVTSDDCGGMYPPLGSIRLIVAHDAADAARDLLRQAGVGSEAAKNAGTTNAPGVSGVSPRAYRFSLGLVVGLILGALLHYGYRHFDDHRDRTDRYYNDSDDLPDEEILRRNGQTVEQRLDQNADGHWDFKAHYKDGVPVSDQLDENFDGKWDGTRHYSARGFLSNGQYDTDLNGVTDLIATYRHGVLLQNDWRPNGTNVILLRQLFRHGVLDEEMRDQNGDGLFDVSIRFDRFNTPIRTNSLRPTTSAP